MTNDKKTNVGGRPRTPDYNKIRHRYAKISKVLNKYADKMVNDYDKSLVYEALEELRQNEKQIETIKNTNDVVRERAKIKARQTRATRRANKDDKYSKVRQELLDSGVNFVFTKKPIGSVKLKPGQQLSEFESKKWDKEIEVAREEVQEQLDLFFETKEEKELRKKS